MATWAYIKRRSTFLIFIFFPFVSSFENAKHDFQPTGIERKIDWKASSEPVPLRSEVGLLKSGVLVRRGEFCTLHGDRLEEVERECKIWGMTLSQGLLIRRQLMVSKVVASSWKLKNERKLVLAIENFERMISLMRLSTDLDLPPVSIFRAIVARRVLEAYPELRDRDRKQIVKGIISEDDSEHVGIFLSAWELKELQWAKRYDVVGYSEESETPVMWEETLYSFLDEQKINYVKEETLREAEKKITPDCLILDDCYINGFKVRWIDAKSFYASGLKENNHFSRSLKKQIQKYEREFGESGAVIFKHGFSRKLRKNHPTTLFLDSGPLLEDIDYNVH